MRHLNLLYHRVNRLDPDPWTLCVSPKHFEEHLEAVKRLSPQPTITFDDGYFDNLSNALPLLEKHDVAAHFFVTSGAIGRETEMWWDALDFLCPEPEMYMREFLRLRALSTHDHERELEQAFDGSDRPQRAERRMLRLEELCLLAACPLATIGAHTITHPVLSQLVRDDQHAEIAGSKRQLEEWIGKRIDVFSYPNGMDADYTSDTVQLVRDAGFTAAYSAFEHDRDDPFQLPRTMVRDWDGDRFLKELTDRR